MIDLFIICHPSAYDCLDDKALSHANVSYKRIACGLSKPAKYDLSEAADFFPSYASLNSSIFESSVILTIWEHIESISKGDYVGFLHTDIMPNTAHKKLWPKIFKSLDKDKTSLGVSYPIDFDKRILNNWELDDDLVLRPSVDPMMRNWFDLEHSIWQIIRRLDPSIYEFAISKNPDMIYSHMFITSRKNFNILGSKLRRILDKLKAGELGLWTPHLFERLVGLYLAEISTVKNVCAFKHYAGSSPLKPGSYSLYGTMAYRYFKTSRKVFV